MSLSQYKHLFKAFYFGLLTISLLFSAVLLDAIARNLRARPFSEKNTKTRTDPFFGAVCHTSDPNEGFFLILSFFEAMAGSMTNLLKKIASPFSLSSSYL